MPETVVIWGFVAIVASALAGLLAGIKNRDYSFWMAWCFIVPPLILLLLFMPRYTGPRPRRRPLDEDDRLEI